MTTRTRRSTLTLAQPFRLRNIDETQPAGAYAIETDEELLDTASRLAYRRLATYIHIRRDGASQVVTLDAADLEQLLQDGVSVRIDPADADGQANGSPSG